MVVCNFEPAFDSIQTPVTLVAKELPLLLGCLCIELVSEYASLQRCFVERFLLNDGTLLTHSAGHPPTHSNDRPCFLQIPGDTTGSNGPGIITGLQDRPTLVIDDVAFRDCGT